MLFRSKIFALGDTKDVTLSGIGTMTLQIADFDHDYLSGATTAKKAAVTFLCKNLLYQTYQMKNSYSSNGGFPAMPLCYTLNDSIYAALPSDLKSVIKTTYKWYVTNWSTEEGKWSGHKLWVPLAFEMAGSNGDSTEKEHTIGNARQYPIFTDNASRIKFMRNGSSSVSNYWSASTPRGYSDSFLCVTNAGSLARNDTTTNNGVCFGLCI